MKVLFSQWMRELDFNAINTAGIPSIVLMENASRGSAHIIREEFPVDRYKNVIILAGPGNNGGDGIAAGRTLSQWGFQPLFLFCSEPENLSGDPKVNFTIIKELGLPWSFLSNAGDLKDLLSRYSSENTVIIDALFGTGMKSPVKDGFFFDIIKELNGSGLKIVSIDLPSGISDIFPPDEGIHVKPDITITFQALKISHIFPDDRNRCGKISVIDIGIPVKYLEDDSFFVQISEPVNFSDLLKKRESGVHKGKLGHGLVFAGSDEKPGASILAAISVLRSGAGLSTAVVSPVNRDLIIRSYPEVMTIQADKFEEIGSVDQFDCILAGPGMGLSNKSGILVKKILSGSTVPVVLDADALTILEGKTEVFEPKRSYPLIITPHPREFSRLSGLEMTEILNNPVTTARNFSRKYDLFTVLKGHYTVISSPDGRVFVNQTGNPGMATAGSGDVLGGIITGMISQFGKDFPIIMILQASVFLHGYAGDIAASLKGESPLIASDIINNISEAFRKVNEFRSEFRFT